MEDEDDFVYEEIPSANNNRLKKDVPTRWTSCCEMLQSFDGKTMVVNRWLGYLGRSDIEINSSEEQLLPYLLEYYDTFSIVTKVLEGSKYSTINIAVVLLEEIKSQMKQKKEKLYKSDVNDVFKNDLLILYENTMKYLPTRFTITDEMIAGTLLDPIFQDCEFVQDYLVVNNYTRNSFLKKMYEKFVGSTAESTQTAQPLQQKKSVLHSLAQKYSKNFTQSTMDEEIDRFKTIHSYADDNLLPWWGSVGREQFPILSKLARSILQLSATSATVERLNSIAGATLSKYRLNMNHHKAEKIMFVFYNYPHVQN